MANPVVSTGLVRACDELGCVADGLDGLLGLIANKSGKEIRIGRDALFYVIEPLHNRMKQALDGLNQVRKEAVGRESHG